MFGLELELLSESEVVRTRKRGVEGLLMLENKLNLEECLGVGVGIGCTSTVCGDWWWWLWWRCVGLSFSLSFGMVEQKAFLHPVPILFGYVEN